MYLNKDIVKEGIPSLREKSVEVKLPLSNDDKEVLKGLYDYVIVSTFPELIEKLDIRPGVGIAAPQVGVNKRMFAINATSLDEENKRYLWAVINPEITYRSKEKTYLPGGEGCLSVDRETCGITPRSMTIKVKCYLYNFETNKMTHVTETLTGYPAIVFQHEYDHLDGILFVDTIEDEQETKVMPLWEEEDIENEED